MEIRLKSTQGKVLLLFFKFIKNPYFGNEGNLGDYKLVQDWEKGIDDNWELYNISKDRTEQNNLIDLLNDFNV